MPYTIAVAGKGGVGKTTLTGMMIQYLADKKEGHDTVPNSTHLPRHKFR